MKHDEKYAMLAYNAWHSYLRYVVMHGRKLTDEELRAHRILEQTIPLDIRRYSRWKAQKDWIKEMILPIAAIVLAIICILTALSEWG